MSPGLNTGGAHVGAGEEHDPPKKGSPEEDLRQGPAGEEAVSPLDPARLLFAL